MTNILEAAERWEDIRDGGIPEELDLEDIIEPDDYRLASISSAEGHKTPPVNEELPAGRSLWV